MSFHTNLSKRSLSFNLFISAIFASASFFFIRSVWFSLACSAFFMIPSVFSVKVYNKYWGLICNLAIICISSIVNFLLVQLNLNIFAESMRYIGLTGRTSYVLSILCYFIIIGVIYCLTLNVKFSVLTSFLVTFILSTIDFFVVQFRGNELMPSDLFAIRTALNVVSSYKFSIPSSMVISWIMAFFWNYMLFRSVKLPKPSAKAVSRVGAFLLSSASVVFIASNPQYISNDQWLSWGSIRNGFLLNFAYQFKSIEKPDDYHHFDFAALEEKYPLDREAKKKPSVLVIMNEAFTDFRCFNGELNTNVPVTPFFDSLSENTIRGFALASIFGGGTSNSEYEFLTGNTLGFLPTGANGYQQYTEDGTYTLNTYFRSLGYHTIAMHPHYPNGWTRSTVWPWFQFDEIYFRDGISFNEENAYRDWITDMEMYEKVLQAFEHKPENTPLFLFGVTVQNHGGYERTGVVPTISLEGYSAEYPMAEQYLELLHMSDQALEYLLTNLEKMDEDVIVLFYGDHQPKLEPAFYEELNGGDLKDLSSQQKQRTVPFIIWANFDIPAFNVPLTSLNYLSSYLLEAANFPLPPYNQFLKDVENSIPALNSIGYYSLSADTFLPYEEAQGAEKEILDTYQILQYHSIKANKNRSSVFFP